MCYSPEELQEWHSVFAAEVDEFHVFNTRLEVDALALGVDALTSGCQVSAID